jgi:hypothetical protein
MLRISRGRKEVRATLNTERPWEGDIREIPHEKSEAASSVAAPAKEWT